MNHQRVFCDPVPPGLGDLKESQQASPSHSLLSASLGLPHECPPSGDLGPESQTQEAPQASEGLCGCRQQLLSPVFAGSKHRQSPACPHSLIQISKITEGVERTNLASLEPPSKFFRSFFDWGGGGVGMGHNNIARFFQR